MVGDGRRARRPALAERGRCGECVQAPAPVPGDGVRQLLVIRETSPVRGGVGQPQTTGWPSKGPHSWSLALSSYGCPSQRVALASSPFSWTLDPTLVFFLLLLCFGFVLPTIPGLTTTTCHVFPNNCDLVTQVFSEEQEVN